MSANAKRSAPMPILDNLKEIGNPHKQKSFDASPHLNGIAIKAADDDYEHVLKFLHSYNGSTATFNAYRRELERLLQWSWRIQQQAVISLRREDIEDFIRFSINPPVAWIGEKNVARFRTKDGEKLPNKDWRPYVVSVSKIDSRNGIVPDKKRYRPSQAAVQSTFAVLSSFYDYLTEERLIEFNPVALIRQRNKFIRGRS